MCCCTSGSGHEAQDEGLLWSGNLVGCLEHFLGSVHLVSLRSTNVAQNSDENLNIQIIINRFAAEDFCMCF